jgi:hypothetical protein
MPRGAFLNLEKLALYGSHPSHQVIELREKLSLVLFSPFDEIG